MRAGKRQVAGADADLWYLVKLAIWQARAHDDDVSRVWSERDFDA
jgi:hypothetical protein